MTSDTDMQAGSLTHWAGKGFWAILDQGLFAGANFALNILLARWLAPADYGAFAVCFAVLLLAGAVHAALIVEPMLVFGAGKYRARFPEYLSILLRAHWIGTSIVGAILLAAGLGLALFRPGSLSVSVMVLSVTLPAILLHWLMRRACYVQLQPRLAATADALYLTVLVPGASLLGLSGHLSPAAGLLLLATASVPPAIWLMTRLRPTRLPDTRPLEIAVHRDHWTYGRWALGSQVLVWTRANVYVLALSIWGGLAAAAAFRALLNVVVPVMHVSTALAPLMLAALARARDRAGFGSSVARWALAAVLAPLGYWLLLSFLGADIVQRLYLGMYSEHAHLVRLLGAVPVLGALTVALSVALKALERPDREFWAYVLSAAVTLTAGLVLVGVWGVLGAAVGSLASYLVAAPAMLWLLRKAGPWSPQGGLRTGTVPRQMVSSRLWREPAGGG